MNIKVLGTGCKSCKGLYEVVLEVVSTLDKEINIDYINDLNKIMEYGIMDIPAMIINDKIVSTGRMLTNKQVEELINSN